MALLKAQDKVEHSATFKSIKLHYWLILELFIVSIHFPPFIPNFVFEIPAMQEFSIDFQYYKQN